jgi:TRAP transporter TAXI family solute receptor
MLALLLAMVMLVAVFAVGCSTPAVEETEEAAEPVVEVKDVFLSFATGGVSGTYYPLGGAMANLCTNTVEGVKGQAESTGASVENATLLETSESDFALLQNDVAFYAVNGNTLAKFEESGAYTNVAGIATLYPETIQIIASAESGIKTVEDLAGMHVAVGAPGSGTEANAVQILAAYGLTKDDLGAADPLSFKEAAEGLKNKQIDAAFITAGYPTSAVTEVSTVRDVTIVSVDKIAELAAKYPFYTEQVIPAGTYKGQDTDITSVAVMAMLAVRGDLDEEIVYQCTKAILEGTEELGMAHAKGLMVTADTGLDGMSIDLHPGAERYYVEAGLK